MTRAPANEAINLIVVGNLVLAISIINRGNRAKYSVWDV